MARVVLEHLSKSFADSKGRLVRAVNDLSLVVETGELVVLVGPSGCGKTTTLRMIAGLEHPDQGRIHLDGQVVNARPPKDRDLAMVFQSHALYPHLTVYENMAFGLKLRRYPKAEIDRRVREAADLLELGACLDRLPNALSGGQRQRVAVGRAMVRQPRLFLFDEPLSNLDAPMRAQMRAEIAQLRRRLSATMIYVTHDQLEALCLGDRIAVMNQGMLQQIDEPPALYQRPANRFVAGFIGSPPMNFWHGIVRRDRAEIWLEESVLRPHASLPPFRLRLKRVPGELTACGNQEVVLGVRPEDLDLSEGCSAVTEEGCIQAEVVAVEHAGAETHVRLVTAGHSAVARCQADVRFALGQRIVLSVPTAKRYFFDPKTGSALGRA